MAAKAKEKPGKCVVLSLEQAEILSNWRLCSQAVNSYSNGMLAGRRQKEMTEGNRKSTAHNTSVYLSEVVGRKTRKNQLLALL